MELELYQLPHTLFFGEGQIYLSNAFGNNLGEDKKMDLSNNLF